MSDNNTNPHLSSFPAPKTSYTDTPTDLDSLTTPDPEQNVTPDISSPTQYSAPLNNDLPANDPASAPAEPISSDDFLPPPEPETDNGAQYTTNTVSEDLLDTPLDSSNPDLLNTPTQVQSFDEDEPLTPTPADEIELTDPVSPDLTDPIAPEITAPDIDTTQNNTYPQPTPPTPTEVPATLPGGTHRAGKGAALALGGFAVLATAVAALLFLQLSGAKSNLSILRSITGHQRTLTPAVTAEPTEEVEVPAADEDLSALPTEEPSPTPSITTTPTVTITTTPTPTNSTPTITVSNAQNAFSNIAAILSKAEGKSSDARLILITVDNVEDPSKSITKYWFRQSDTQKSYFYIMADTDGQIKVFDKQIYVTPDNNIPSLNEMVKNNALGLDLKSTVDLSNSTVIANSGIKSDPSSIYAQFVRTRLGSGPETTIWQITYKYLNRTSPVVVQVDSQAKKVVYSNIKYNLPSTNK